MKDVKVEETTQYDNCIGYRNTDDEPDRPSDLSSFLGIEDEEKTDEKEWKKHWVGMPDFDQDDNPPYKKLYLNFRNEEDYQAFAKLIDQNLTEKTKSIWYPKLNREENSLLRWIEE
jgi:hypothetical protein